MKTREEVEREHKACYGLYDATTNSWLEICDLTEYTQCDRCGYWFRLDEIKQTNDGGWYCLQECLEVYEEMKREEEEYFTPYTEVFEQFYKVV